MTATERVSLINSAETLLVSDYDLTSYITRLTNNRGGICFSDISTKPEFLLNTSTGEIVGGKAFIPCIRVGSNPIGNQSFLAGYELAGSVTGLNVSAGRKIFIELDDAKIQDPTLIEDAVGSSSFARGLGLGTIKSATSWPTHTSYMKLWENVAGTWTDWRRNCDIVSDALDISLKKTSDLADFSSNTPTLGQLARRSGTERAPYSLTSSDIPGLSGLKFGGDGSDGVVDGTSNITITGSDNTIIYKNYSTWNAGTAPRTFTVVPKGCTVIIKVSGNCNLSNWTFNLSGKGQPGGQPWLYATQAATAGTSQSQFYGAIPGTIGGGAVSGGGAASNESSASGTGAGTTAYPYTIANTQARRLIQIYCGAGGGGGNGSGGPGSGGTGGTGGGCIGFQIGGSLTLNNTTTIIDVSGVAGSAASVGSGGVVTDGGGGGAGGQVLILYNDTLTGTCTPNVAGGLGGAAAGGGVAGRNGANGSYLIEKNIAFV